MTVVGDIVALLVLIFASLVTASHCVAQLSVHLFSVKVGVAIELVATVAVLRVVVFEEAHAGCVARFSEIFSGVSVHLRTEVLILDRGVRPKHGVRMFMRLPAQILKLYLSA